MTKIEKDDEIPLSRFFLLTSVFFFLSSIFYLLTSNF